MAAVCRVVQRGPLFTNMKVSTSLELWLIFRLFGSAASGGTRSLSDWPLRTIPHDVAVKLNLRQVAVYPLRPTEHYPGGSRRRCCRSDRDLHLLGS